MAEDNKWDSLMQTVDAYVRENRSYLRPRFAVIDLSLELSIPQYLISKAINHSLGVSYSAWMNRLRIEHFLNLVANEGEKESRLYVLAMRSGFQSKASFINAFKIEKGVTPGAYVGAVRKGPKGGAADPHS
jgi:AraC-like DNA-binding protein